MSVPLGFLVPGRRAVSPGLGLVLVLMLALGFPSASMADQFGFSFHFDKDPITGKNIPKGSLDYKPPNGPSNNYDIAGYTACAQVQWTDGFPDGSGQSDGYYESSECPPVSPGPPWSDYQNGDHVICKQTFGTGEVTERVQEGYTFATMDGSADADCAYATTVVAVFAVHPDGSFTPLPGALVQFQDSSPAGWAQKWTTTIRPSATGKPLAWATFGKTSSPAPTGDPQNPDMPYPSGFRPDNFRVSVSCPGYRTSGATASDTQTGVQWMGAALAVYLQPTTADPSLGSTSTIAPIPDLPTSSDGTITPPPSSGTGTGGSGTSTGSGSVFDPASFIKSLMDAITTFFTLQQPDVDALKAAGTQLTTWGPFGVPAQLKAQWDNAFGANGQGAGTDGSDPNYWVMPLTFQAGASSSYGSAAPAGYNMANLPVHQRLVTMFDNMFPTSFDFSPYASILLTGRFITLIAIWLSVAVGLYKKFTPDLRV